MKEQTIFAASLNVSEIKINKFPFQERFWRSVSSSESPNSHLKQNVLWSVETNSNEIRFFFKFNFFKMDENPDEITNPTSRGPPSLLLSLRQPPPVRPSLSLLLPALPLAPDGDPTEKQHHPKQGGNGSTTRNAAPPANKGKCSTTQKERTTAVPPNRRPLLPPPAFLQGDGWEACWMVNRFPFSSIPGARWWTLPLDPRPRRSSRTPLGSRVSALSVNTDTWQFMAVVWRLAFDGHQHLHLGVGVHRDVDVDVDVGVSFVHNIVQCCLAETEQCLKRVQTYIVLSTLFGQAKKEKGKRRGEEQRSEEKYSLFAPTQNTDQGDNQSYLFCDLYQQHSNNIRLGFKCS